MATGLMIGGAALSAGGSVYGGLKAKKNAKKQANLLRHQAILEREAAEFEALQQERQFDKFLGKQSLNIAASGIAFEGTPMQLLEETMRDKEETINNIITTGNARGSALESEARNVRRAGKDAFIASIFQGLGSGASTLSKIK